MQILSGLLRILVNLFLSSALLAPIAITSELNASESGLRQRRHGAREAVAQQPASSALVEANSGFYGKISAEERKQRDYLLPLNREELKILYELKTRTEFDEFCYLKSDFSKLTLGEISREVQNWASRKPLASSEPAESASTPGPRRAWLPKNCIALLENKAVKCSLVVGAAAAYYYFPTVQHAISAVSNNYFAGMLVSGIISDNVRRSVFKFYYKAMSSLDKDRVIKSVSLAQNLDDLARLQNDADAIIAGELRDYVKGALATIQSGFEKSVLSGSRPEDAASYLMSEKKDFLQGLRAVMQLPTRIKNLDQFWALREKRLRYVLSFYDKETEAKVFPFVKRLRLLSRFAKGTGSIGKPGLHFQGAPGVGKSVLVRAIAWALNIPVADMSFKAKQIHDVEDDRAQTGYGVLQFFRKLSPHTKAFVTAADAQGYNWDNAIIFVDEADKVLSNSCYGDDWRRWLGDLTNPEQVAISLSDLGIVKNIGQSGVILASNNKTGCKEIDDRLDKVMIRPHTVEKKIEIAMTHLGVNAAAAGMADTLETHRDKVLQLFTAFAKADTSRSSRQIKMFADNILVELDDIEDVDRKVLIGSILADEKEECKGSALTDGPASPPVSSSSASDPSEEIDLDEDTVEGSAMARQFTWFGGMMKTAVIEGTAPIATELAKMRADKAKEE